MAAAAIAAHGGINVLCCNAGIMPASKLSDMQESEIDSIFGTNIKGTIFAVQACTAALAASGHGRFVSLFPFKSLFFCSQHMFRIVLTSSITGPITGFPGWSHYGASKVYLSFEA
jgi:3-oxoacyl-[acyl-carrier protein] reductase